MKDKNIQIFISATFFITVYFALMYSFEVHLNTVILNPVYLSKLNDNVPDKLGMNRNGKTIAYKRFKSEIACTMDRQALVYLSPFFRLQKTIFRTWHCTPTERKAFNVLSIH